MSHMIERKEDGSYSIAYAGEACWHGLGKNVHNDLTPEQMLVEAQVDWAVEKQPLYRKVGDDFEVTGNCALVRDLDNKILSYVSEDWNPLQNAEAFGFFHEFVMAGDMEMHTAGSLKGGQVVWCLAKLKNPINIFGKDVIEPYFLFTNPHRFGSAIDVRLTNIRVVCNNTITMALGEKATNQVVKMSHRSMFNPETVKALLGMADMKNRKFSDAMEFLTTKRYTEDSATEFFAKVFPKVTKKDDNALSKNAKDAIGIVEIQPGADIFPGTFYNLLNAVTFLGTHEIGRETDTRLYNQWFGSTQKRNVTALNTALDMAEVV